jgi:hypothetical protein
MKTLKILSISISTVALLAGFGLTARADDPHPVDCYFAQTITCPDGSVATQVNTSTCYVQFGCGECGGADVAPVATSCPTAQPKTCYVAQQQYCGDGSMVTQYIAQTCTVYHSCSECSAMDTAGNSQTCPEKQNVSCYQPYSVTCPDGSQITQYNTIWCSIYHSCSECSAQDNAPSFEYCPTKKKSK